MQHFISAAFIMIVSITCFYTVEFIGYRVVALILMVTVSLLAIMFDILPVLIAAILSALIWNFFFIPPLYTFHVDNAEDFLMFLMYFVIAMVNAVLTFQIRKAEQKARDKEEKENTIKIYNTLFNSLSHELRTPISTILGSVDTLKENKEKLTEDNQAALLTEIDKASIRLNRQVENLLNISRLESGMIKLNLDWCDMNEMIYSVIQKLAAQSANHEISFTANEDIPLFKIDSGLMEQVLHNIIFNCVQYTPENSVIAIDVSNQNDICKIVISDNGNGFPESEIQFVFDKFYRLPNTKTGGTGLGLSIAKGFTEAHKGQIKLENNESGGAKFTIEIPAATSYINHLKNE
jgi:two-component system, OmpR family, sensor histidine kinase KdpD